MRTSILSALVLMAQLFFRSRTRMFGHALIALALTLFSCGGGGSDFNNSQISTVPDGAQWTVETVNRPTAPPEYAAVIGFALGVALDPLSYDQAMLELDYMRLIEKNPDSGEETIVAAEEYNDGPRALGPDEGGLFIRIPKWFPPEDYHTPVTNAKIANGLLTIDVAKTPDKIVHWWTDRATAQSKYRYYVEVRARVTGQAALQLGSDWWRTLKSDYNHYDETCKTSNNCLAWHSDWIADTKGSFVVRKVPVR